MIEANSAVVTIAIPKDPKASALFCQQQLSKKTNKSNLQQRIILLTCRWEKPGVVWRGLAPALLRSPGRIAKQYLLGMLELSGVSLTSKNDIKTIKFKPNNNDTDENTENEEQTWKSVVWGRQLHLTLKNISTEQAEQQQQKLILWIQPPICTYYNSFFTCTMIAYEHRMILYQSLAAWFSTLGGGHFFCRHLATAVRLAKWQRHVALLMGDYSMAYKCTINEAYSYIYAGMFRKALKTLDMVAILNKRVDIHPLDSVIVNMCHSARLFCKRVRNASLKLEGNRTEQEAKTSDDYQRIRVVR